jgi:hypothetical protein
VAIRRRTWIAVAILSTLVLVAGLTSLGIIYDHLQRPKFVATLSPIQVSTPECMALITDPFRHGYNSGSAQAMCQEASTGIWFRAEVRNVGHRLAFIKDCVVTGLDSAGHQGFVGTLRTGDPAPAGLGVDAGTSVTWEWYVVGTPFKPPSQVSHYETRCAPIEYDGHVPS